jgi:hypothetical protein
MLLDGCQGRGGDGYQELGRFAGKYEESGVFPEEDVVDSTARRLYAGDGLATVGLPQPHNVLVGTHYALPRESYSTSRCSVAAPHNDPRLAMCTSPLHLGRSLLPADPCLPITDSRRLIRKQLTN